MARRASRRAGRTLRAVAGAALAPLSLAAGLAAVGAVASLAAGALSSPGGGASGGSLFLCAFFGYAALHALRLVRLRRLYVLGHELAHALAAWARGGKVYRIVVRAESGYVNLSRTGIFVALAPYWLPVYAVAVVAAYRAALWAGPPPWAAEAFVLLMGASLSFHLSHTVESLTTARQSDLDSAGVPLSLALIVLLNALVVLAALKCLFPAQVSVAAAAARALDWLAALARLADPA